MTSPIFEVVFEIQNLILFDLLSILFVLWAIFSTFSSISQLHRLHQSPEYDHWNFTILYTIAYTIKVKPTILYWKHPICCCKFMILDHRPKFGVASYSFSTLCEVYCIHCILAFDILIVVKDLRIVYKIRIQSLDREFSAKGSFTFNEKIVRYNRTVRFVLGFPFSRDRIIFV